VVEVATLALSAVQQVWLVLQVVAVAAAEVAVEQASAAVLHLIGDLEITTQLEDQAARELQMAVVVA
jgi:hypothetical protein